MWIRSLMLSARFVVTVPPSNAPSTPLLRGYRLILDSPIPRPEPLEQLRCDQSKEYAADGVCFPIASSTNSAFSIKEIFGRSIKGVCPVSQESELGQVHFQVFPSMSIDPPPTSFAEGRAHFTLDGPLPSYSLIAVLFLTQSRSTVQFTCVV